MPRLALLVALIGSGLCSGQPRKQPGDDRRSEAEHRLAALHAKFAGLLAGTPLDKELQAACSQNCAAPEIQQALQKRAAERSAALDGVIAEMHREVDSYIQAAVDPHYPDAASLARDLARILPQPLECAPSVFLVGRSVIALYCLRKGNSMGERATSVTLRAYNPTGQRLALGDTAGEALDGYDRISVARLHPLTTDQLWLVLSGPMSAANGPNMRMCLYAYDGGRFRILWFPANDWGEFTVQATAVGFRVDGPYYRVPGERHDLYFLFKDGVVVTHEK